MAQRPVRSVVAFAAALLLAASLLPAGAARAAYPERPIRLVVPYQPGGGSDLVGRVIAARASEILGQPILVENRSGAAGTIAGRFVATSPPDGYILLIDSLSIAQNASLFRNPSFNASQDLLPIAQLVEFPFVVAMNKKVRARSIVELVALARERPGRMNVAESGSSPRLAAELFRIAAGGVQFTFVPYRGSAPSVSALLSGEVDLFFSDLPSIAQYVSDPNSPVTALSTSGARRSPVVPAVATAREAGIPEFETSSWYGIFAPRGTPMEIARALHAALNHTLESPEVRTRLATMSADPVSKTQAQFAEFYQDEIRKWRDVIQRSGMPLIE
jgi:tripartite-type tricarboxylate transporter receptor subunit TctC